MSNNQIVLQFEKELINKIEQKQLPNTNAEQTLVKYFKYFDIENKGICGLRDWIKALEKLGVQFHKASDIQEIFSTYESEKKGVLDYKLFAKQICSNYNQDIDNTQNQEGLNKLNFILVNIYTVNAETFSCEFNCKRQPYISQPDYSYLGFFLLDFFS